MDSFLFYRNHLMIFLTNMQIQTKYLLIVTEEFMKALYEHDNLIHSFCNIVHDVEMSELNIQSVNLLAFSKYDLNLEEHEHLVEFLLIRIFFFKKKQMISGQFKNLSKEQSFAGYSNEILYVDRMSCMQYFACSIFLLRKVIGRNMTDCILINSAEKISDPQEDIIIHVKIVI